MFNIDWEEKFRNKTAEEAMDAFEKVYNNAVKECVPIVEMCSNDRKKPIWMTRHALRKVRRKHSSWIRYLNTKQGSDYLKYVKDRNDATHETKRARKESCLQ